MCRYAAAAAAYFQSVLLYQLSVFMGATAGGARSLLVVIYCHSFVES